MPRRRAFRDHLARRNVEPQEKGVPNPPKVQTQGEVANVEFREAIRMMNEVVTNKSGQHRGARKKEADSLRIFEFMRINPPSFTGSNSVDDTKNFLEELKKVFDVMNIDNTARVELAAY